MRVSRATSAASPWQHACSCWLPARGLRNPSGSVIIARNSTATGSGRAIQSMEVDLAMQDRNSTFDAIYRVTRDGHMRIDIIDHGKRIYTEAYDGHAGWDQGKDGKAPFIDPHGDALWHGTQFPGNIFGLEDMQKNGHTLEYMGRETVAGVDYHGQAHPE